MDTETKVFFRSYLEALRQGNAAVFVGAGLSQPCRYANWKELLRLVAEELALDVDREWDLPALAQYYETKLGRQSLSQLLVNEYGKFEQPSQNHRILAELPIKAIWTTNYEALLETALRAVGKRPAVVFDARSFTISGFDSVVYKMHGDISAAHDVVITTDDYQKYNEKRLVFTTVLEADLISKTFLFLGLSFTDPNLDYVMSKVSGLLGKNKRTHYCLMKRFSRSQFETESDFQYAMRKQAFKIEDLKRLGVIVVLVDSYDEITKMLQQFQQALSRRHVFISGSAQTYGDDWDDARAWALGQSLSSALVKHDFHVVTGFGLGIGSSVITGALEGTIARGRNLSEQLHLRLFPQNIQDKSAWTRHRADILKSVGIAVFLFGNKAGEETADGVLEEFDLAVENGVIPIPVGATGFAAKTLWDRVMQDFPKYVPVPPAYIAEFREHFEALGATNADPDQIVEHVLTLAKRLAVIQGGA